MNISGYEFVEEVVHLGPYAVVRAQRGWDRQPVLIKLPIDVGSDGDSDALEREAALLRDLTIPGVPRTYELVRHDSAAYLVLEDRGLAPLARQLVHGRIDLASFFRIGLQLCTFFGDLHRRDLVYGSLSSKSTLASLAGDELQLLDFSLVSRSLLATRTAGRRAHGDPVYIAPEQTGRINRTVDHRADLYALGILLYELLTGAPPFRSDDSLELIHSHIARTPAPPATIAGDIPEQISRIVMRLLAKASEDRYQSALGLRHDLELCEREWAARRAIPLFEIARHDVSERFLVPQRLYGREREVRELMAAFDETCDGRASILLVAGYSGIGKTSLISELYAPIVRERGYFLSGKFDQVVRNIPYGALIQAFRGLVWQLLTESEERLAEWRRRLSEALGANGGVLAEVIPEIELILGKQTPPPPLDPTEARNRFGYMLQRFVGTLARREHPLVVFLDDLQWVDAATLDVLHALLTSVDLHHRLLIGAYRDNEVDAAHLLTHQQRLSIVVATNPGSVPARDGVQARSRPARDGA
jgi:histidine kinase